MSVLHIKKFGEKRNKMKFNKLFKRSILGDYDKDGVMNAFDCQPKNKRKQDASKRPWSDAELAAFERGLGKDEKETKRMVEEEWKRRGRD